MNQHTEEQRIQQEYQERAQNPLFSALYTPYSAFHIYHQARLELLTGKALQRAGLLPLAERRILDVGCGSGGHLLRFLLGGAAAAHLHGIDVIPERIENAKKAHPGMTFHLGNANALPYPDAYFDVVTQFTVFSSILDAQLRAEIAHQMVRVLRPGGVVVWYDARLQSPNPALTAFQLANVAALFPDLALVFRTPSKLRFGMSRRIIPYSWELVAFLERFPFLCEMDFVVLQKPAIEKNNEGE